MKTIINLLFLTPLLFSTSICIAQLADVDGTIRSNTDKPTMELYDDVDERVEGSWEEFDHEIFLYSTYGDLKLGATDNGGNRSSAYMTLKSDNKRVGINTSNPTSVLQVNVDGSERSIGINGISQVWKDSATILGTMSHIFDAILVQNQKTPTTETIATYSLQTKQSDGSSPLKMLVDGKGDVGIGTFTNHPEAAVHLKHRHAAVVADRPQNAVRFENDHGNKNYFNFYVANSDGFLEFYSKEGAGAYIALIDDVSGEYTVISDARLKNNIRPLDAVIEKINRLNPVSYFYNHQRDRSERYTGFLAQELNEAFPEFVTYRADSDQYTVNYAGLSTIAIKAIQEQQELIDALQSEIETLNKNQTARLDRIESLLNIK